LRFAWWVLRKLLRKVLVAAANWFTGLEREFTGLGKPYLTPKPPKGGLITDFRDSHLFSGRPMLL